MRCLLLLLTCSISVSLYAAETEQLSKEQIEQIIFDFRVGVDWHIKDKGVEKLAQMGDKAVPILIKCLKKQLPEPLASRIEAARQKQDTDLLMVRADGSSIPVQGYAERTLIKIGKPAVPLLLESIDTQPETVSRVVRILGKIGDKRAVSPLITVLNDNSKDCWTRANAAESLSNLDTKEAIPHLIKSLKGLPDDKYNNQRFLNKIANSLASVSGRSFGFTYVLTRGGKGGDWLQPHYLFESSSIERDKAIATWNEWWRDYKELTIAIDEFFDSYANKLKSADEKTKELRCTDYIQFMEGLSEENVVIDKSGFIWTNYLRLSLEPTEPAECREYQIICKDIKDNPSEIVVMCEDKVILAFDGVEAKYAAKVKRVLLRHESTFKIKQEEYSRWWRQYYD